MEWIQCLSPARNCQAIGFIRRKSSPLRGRSLDRHVAQECVTWRAKERLSKGIWSQQVCSKRTHLVWGRGVIEDHLSREHYRQKFIGFKIGVDTEKFSKQESALLDKQEKWGLNINVIVYCWIDRWLCNKDTIFWGWGRRGGWGGGGGAGRGHHLLWGLVGPVRV